jgi:hypothetical protein
VTSTRATASISAAFMKYAPCAWNSRLTSSLTCLLDHGCVFGGAQHAVIERLPVTMSWTAFLMLADRSMKAGAFPGPTP